MNQRGPKWITGPNALHHEMYVAFGYHRVTSRLRGDGWDMSWETWRDLWLPHWSQRGRQAHDVCMCRKDLEKGWQPDNVEIITRREHSKRVREYYK